MRVKPAEIRRVQEERARRVAPLDLAPIEARADAATFGPWVVEWLNEGFYAPPSPPLVTLFADAGPDRHGLNLIGRLEPDANGAANLSFIANARTDVPALIAEVKRLRAIVDTATQAAEDVALSILSERTERAFARRLWATLRGEGPTS